MSNRIEKFSLKVIDNALTLNGTISPRATDVAFIGSDPDLEKAIVIYRLQHLFSSLLGTTLSGAKTYGAFNLTDEGYSAEGMYALGRIGDGLKAILWNKVALHNYHTVYDHFFDEFFAIPPEIRSKMSEHLVLNGIPENKVSDYTIPNLVHKMNDGTLTTGLASGVLAPALQVLASKDSIPPLINAGILGISYLSLILGPSLAESYHRVLFEWNTIRTASKSARESNSLGSHSRLNITKEWSSDNISRFNKHNFTEGLIRRIGDFISAAAVFSNRSDIFGVINMIDGSMAGFIGILSTISAFKNARIDSKAFSLAANFCRSGVFLPTSTSWDTFRTQRKDFDSPSNDYLGDSEICRFVNFRPLLSTKEQPQISGSLFRGAFNMVDGKSGDGKSLFLYALRGMAKSDGNVIFGDANGGYSSIYDLSQNNLRKRIVYFSPDIYKGNGLRIADMYSDPFIDERVDTTTSAAVLRAMCVDDALLERQIKKLHNKKGVDRNASENTWEDGLFSKLSIEELDQIIFLRSQRLQFATDRIKKLGENLQILTGSEPLSTLSSGMRERILLDRVLFSLENNVDILVLDEPLGRVDPDTAITIVNEICLRILNLPPEKRPALVMVSNVHKQEITEVVRSVLGPDSLNILKVK